MYIVATISKNSYAPEKIEEILRAGATILRFNLSHGTPEEATQKILVARGVITKMGLVDKVRIIADLPGNKLRLGSFEPSEYPLKTGERIIFKSGTRSENPKEFIPVNFVGIGKYVKVGQVVSVGDGELGCLVTEILDDDSFAAGAVNDRPVLSMKALNIGTAIDTLDHFTEATLAHINNLINIKPELVAFSFVRSAEDVRKGRALLAPHLTADWNPKIIVKIESPEGVANIDEIAKEADILMVARGDLGLTAPNELLGIYQKKIVKAGKDSGKEVIVATQILDSLLQYHIPQRAEVLDLTNIVLDGAQGIMLAKETGISMTPGRSVEVARRIIDAVELYVSTGKDRL